MPERKRARALARIEELPHQDAGRREPAAPEVPAQKQMEERLQIAHVAPVERGITPGRERDVEERQERRGPPEEAPPEGASQLGPGEAAVPQLGPGDRGERNAHRQRDQHQREVMRERRGHHRGGGGKRPQPSWPRRPEIAREQVQ